MAIHQPNLFPRLKILQKLVAADLWVVLDDVQFSRQDYQHRALIVPTFPSQRAHWLTVPIHLPKGQRTNIREAATTEPDLLRHLENGLIGAYSQSTVVEQILRTIRTDYCSDDCLTSLGVASTAALLAAADFPNLRTVRASDLRDHSESKSEGILQILKLVGATSYLADSGALSYLDSALLSRNGVDVKWQLWKRPDVTLGLSHLQLRNGSAINVSIRRLDVFRSHVNSLATTPDRNRAEIWCEF